MALELLALILGVGLLALAVCVKPVEAGLRTLADRVRRARRRRRKRLEAIQAEEARRAFLARTTGPASQD